MHGQVRRDTRGVPSGADVSAAGLIEEGHSPAHQPECSCVASPAVSARLLLRSTADRERKLASGSNGRSTRPVFVNAELSPRAPTQSPAIDRRAPREDHRGAVALQCRDKAPLIQTSDLRASVYVHE